MEQYIPGDALLLKPKALRTDASSITETIKASELFKDAEHVCLLHSAPSWCAPCARSGPMLTARYTALKSRLGAKVEFVFVSHDHESEDFAEHYAKMPWAAIPFDAADAQSAPAPESPNHLRQQLQRLADGVPTLNVIDYKTGNMTNADAIEDIAGDSSEGCKGFPWKKMTFAEAAQDLVLKKGDKETTWADLAKNTSAIVALTSASWCGPCVSYSPHMIKAAAGATKRDPSIAFVLFGSDREADKHKSYAEHYAADFWIVPFEHPAKGAFSREYGVSGIPSTISIKSSDLSVINDNCRAMVMKDPEGANAPWVPLPPPLVVEFGRTEECFSSFANQKAKNSAVILILHNIAEGDAAVATVIQAYAAAAASFKAANASSSVRFLVTKPGPKADEKPDATKCNECKKNLAEVSNANCSCDACGKPAEEKHMRCSDCDVDICNTCMAENKVPANPDAFLWGQLSGDIAFDTASVKDLKQAYMVKFNLFEHKSVSMIPASFDKEADVHAFFAKEL